MAGTPYDPQDINDGDMAVPPATITVGEIPPEGSDTGFQTSSPFIDYFVQNSYEGYEETFQLPIASPKGFQGRTCSFVQVAAPILKWICDWTAKSTNGSPPPAPPMQAADPNWVLLTRELEPAMVEEMADGESAVYRLSGRYVYGHKNPPKAINQVACFARPPWISPSLDRTVPDSVFEPGIADLSGASSTGSSNTPASPGSPGKPTSTSFNPGNVVQG